jgi:hypothetical protein
LADKLHPSQIHGIYHSLQAVLGQSNAGLKSGSLLQNSNGIGVGELLYNGTEVYLDDILVYGDTPKEYLDNLPFPEAIQESMVALLPRESAPSGSWSSLG